MKVLPTLLAASVCMSCATYAADSAIVEITDTQNYVLDQENQRLADTYARMLRYYDQRNFSSVRAVRVLMGNYPHHVEPILYAAFERYPNHYRHIIKAAIDAEPAFTREIISMALSLKVADPADIVRIAVEAEPSYADTIVATVDEMDPTQFANVVRVAVLTEPQTADGILRSNRDAEIGKLESILHTVLSSAPTLGSYLVDTISDLIGFSKTEVAPQNKNKRAIQLIRSAYNSGGLDKSEVQVLAAKHELSDEEIKLILGN
ncbi:hypothetical protein [Pseudidiomarina woesei]|nr:hypothetical protein [Pseudidiomarina woesei]